MQTAKRKAVVGSLELETLTKSHIEGVFQTVRQELKQFEREGLGYSRKTNAQGRDCAQDRCLQFRARLRNARNAWRNTRRRR